MLDSAFVLTYFSYEDKKMWGDGTQITLFQGTNAEGRVLSKKVSSTK